MRRNDKGLAGVEPLDHWAAVKGIAIHPSKSQRTVCQHYYNGTRWDGQWSVILHQHVGRFIWGPHESEGGPKNPVLRDRGARTPIAVWQCQWNNLDGGTHLESRMDAIGQSTKRIGWCSTTKGSSLEGACLALDRRGLHHHSINWRKAFANVGDTSTNAEKQFWYRGLWTMRTVDPADNSLVCCWTYISSS